VVESQPSKLLVAGSIPVSRSRVLEADEELKRNMAYQQAQIAVTKTEDFEQLKSALDRIFNSATVEKFYSKLQGRTVYVREFEKILDLGILESVDSGLAKSGKTAKALYGSLTVSDQALMREFYLERIEKVDTKVRQKYQKVYRYY
jgi:hypothetical protein